jgi:hypothetical protein
MKILIITVGNRQIAWRCQDGVIRCLGVSGNPNDGSPDHVTELYKELGAEKPKGRYFVRHLGQLLHEKCEELGDFGNVELLLDRKIVEDEVQKGLEEVWLIGTDQPPDVDADFRSGDTIWLSKLMSGKIGQTWKQLKVETWNLTVNVSNLEAIREEYEQFILKYLIDKSSDAEAVTLLIENKGSVPAIASSLEICAAALVRQFEVIRVTPQEPSQMYVGDDPEQKSAVFASKYRQQSMSQYFLPIERQGILLSWKQGNFAGAEIWMKPHQQFPKYRALSKLANLLAQAANLEIARVLGRMKQDWLGSNDLRSITDESILANWKNHPAIDSKNHYDVIWESTFLVFLYSRIQNYTGAFFQLSLIIERLLFERYTQEKWIENNVIIIPKEKQRYKNDYEPSFKELMDGWCKRDSLKEGSCWYKLIDAIRKLRNVVIHDGKSISEKDILKIWDDSGVKTSNGSEAVFLPLYKICEKLTWKAPQQSLLGSIYDWSLIILSDESN